MLLFPRFCELSRLIPLSSLTLRKWRPTRSLCHMTYYLTACCRLQAGGDQQLIHLSRLKPPPSHLTRLQMNIALLFIDDPTGGNDTLAAGEDGLRHACCTHTCTTTLIIASSFSFHSEVRVSEGRHVCASVRSGPLPSAVCVCVCVSLHTPLHTDLPKFVSQHVSALMDVFCFFRSSFIKPICSS